ncbi:MAG: glycosyltransferase family 2 protein [Candidatus Dormibacteria bacterium]
MSPSPAQHVEAIIVSHNTVRPLRECLTSLLHEGPRSVVVVDNASSDGSADMVAAEFPTVRLIRNADNVGFARAVNQALRDASSTFVLLLNPDAVMTRGSLGILTDYLLDFPTAGAAGPAMLHPDGRLRVMPAGRQPTLWRVFTHATGLSRLSGVSPVFDGWQHRAGVHDRGPLAVEWLTGGCLLVRTDAAHAVGLLSERWFLYAEDLDLCKRLTDAGWRIVHLPNAVVYHRFGSSTPDVGAVNTRWIDAMTDYYRLRWSPNPITDLAWRLTFAGGFIARSAGYALVAERRPAQRSAWRREARKYAAYARAVVRS